MIRVYIFSILAIQLLCIPLCVRAQNQAQSQSSSAVEQQAQSSLSDPTQSTAGNIQANQPIAENKKEAQSKSAVSPTTNFSWRYVDEDPDVKMPKKTNKQSDIQIEKADAAESQEHKAVLISRHSGFSIEQSPLRKIARGAVNATLGWVEIPRQMIKANNESGDIAGVFWGPLRGFAYFVGRTAVGIYEMTTFLLPPYKTIVDPEFILSDEEDD